MYAPLSRAFFVSLVLIILVGFGLYAGAALVNINTASLTELDTLPGVGPTIAQRIIDGRPYSSATEISNVEGIGEPGSASYDNIISLITVGEDENGEDTEDEEDSDVEEDADEDSAESNVVDVRPSSYSADAGKDKVGQVGVPLEFRGDANFSVRKKSDFNWSFGNGAAAWGPVVSHAYEYPGEYAVVLVVRGPEGEVKDMVNVKIHDTELSIVTVSPQKIEIMNNSKTDANLYGHALVARGKVFVFPRDTIIRAGQKVALGSSVTGLRAWSLPEVEIIHIGADYDIFKLGRQIEEEREERRELVAQEINSLQGLLAQKTRTAGGVSQSVPVVATISEEAEQSDEEVEEVTQVANTLEAVESVADSSWWERLMQFFLRTR